MEHTYWQKQTKEQPLFPDLEWSRPETKQSAGKLLIIGGNKYGFSAPAEAYSDAERAGVGMTRVLLPMGVKPMLTRLYGHTLEMEFAAGNPSGSFAQGALSEWLDIAQWADGVLIAGDLGRNSETAIVMEKFLHKFGGQVTLVKDAADIALGIPGALQRAQTNFVVTMAELQKLNTLTNSTQPVTLSMDTIRLVDLLHWITTHYPITITTRHHTNMFVAHAGQVCTTKIPDNPEAVWRVKTAASASVWWLQNPSKPYEAINCSLVY